MTETTPETAAANGTLWWRLPFRMFQTNLREIDADLDVERVLDQIQEYGADTWLLSVGGIVSNYPTALTHQTVNPVLVSRSSGDLVGDALDAARRRGVRVVARMDFSKVARTIAEEHPDWTFVAPDGSRQVYNGLTSVCPSGTYYQEKLFEVLAEVLERYEIDGFFFNWMSFNEVDYEKRYRGVCQCLACVRAFRARTGAALPTGPSSAGYAEWQAFAAETLDTLQARIRAFVAEHRPEAPLLLGEQSDIVFHEANNAIGRELWIHNTAEHVSMAKSHRPNVPVLVNSVAFVDMPYRLVSEDPHHFEQYLVQAIARGANPSTYIMGTPDEFPYAALEAGSRITRFHATHSHVYTGLVPVARTLLLRPYVSPLEGLTAEQEVAGIDEFRGIWSALSAHHIPFDALSVAHLARIATSGELDRYSVVIAPDIGPVSDDVATALDAWVARGGRLLLTGSAAIVEDRHQLRAAGVERITAVLATREETWSSAILPDAGERSRALPILGSFHALSVADDAETSGQVLSKAPYGPPEKCYGHLPLGHPATVRHPFGDGKVVVLPWTPGRAYRELGISAVADHIALEVKQMLGDDLELTTDLPSQVDVTIGRSVAGDVVHLRNLTGAHHQGYREPVPIAAGHVLRLGERHANQVRALVADKPLEIRSDGAVVLPPIDLFEVLVID